MVRMSLFALVAGAAVASVAACSGGGATTSGQVAGVQPCDAGGASGPPPPGCGLVCRVELPVQFRDRLPVVTVWVNDKPADMVLDTGATATDLTPDGARRLGLTDVVPIGGHTMGIGGEQPRFKVLARRIAFGQITATDYPLFVLKMGGRHPADGSLGDDFLHHYEIDLDLPHAMVRLYQGRPCPGRLPGWSTEDAVLPAIHPLPRQWQLAVPVRLDGHPFTALIDSGSSAVGVGTAAVQALDGFQADSAGDPEAKAVGFGPATVSTDLHRFASLQVGSETMPDVEATVLNLRSRRFDVLLGFDYLRTHKVWISYATNQVHVAHTW